MKLELSGTYTVTIVVTLQAGRCEQVNIRAIERLPDATTRASPTFIPEDDKARSLAYIAVDFADANGLTLVPIQDERLRGWFQPCQRSGQNLKPVERPIRIYSPREVRQVRLRGLALVKLTR